MEQAAPYRTLPKPALVALTEQQRRALAQLALLQTMGKGAKLIIEFQGLVMLMSVAQPAGRVE